MDPDWETCSPRSGKLSLGTHSLSISCFGPARREGQPVIVIIPGIASSIKEWPVVVRGVSDLARTYLYERSGFGDSDVSPHPPTAEQIASELDSLLTKAGVGPPYVLACHSYGGIIAREFVHRRGGAVAGIVFVDANTEETPSTFPNASVQAVSRGLNTLEVTIGQDHGLSEQGWQALLADDTDPRNEEAGQREFKHYHSSGLALMAKKQIDLQPPLLGDRPLIVLHANYARDLGRIYDAGCAAGNGTSEERHEMEKFMSEANEMEERMQRKTLSLSTNVRFIHVPESGHYIHMIRPKVVIDSLRRVLENANGLAPTAADAP